MTDHANELRHNEQQRLSAATMLRDNAPRQCSAAIHARGDA